MKTARTIDGNSLGSEFISKLWGMVAVGQKDECWLWRRPMNKARYPTIRNTRLKVYMKPHRAVYAIMNGRTPAGLVVCHACDNPMCCNPYHLFLGTQKDNMADCVSKKRDLRNYGQRHHLAKLTEDQVRAIHDDPRPSRQICKEYGIGPTQVKRIRREEHWPHLWGKEARHARP